MRLRWSTPGAWTETVLTNFDRFLGDHANCERKASALALKLVVHYPDRTELVDAMVALAKEELEHFDRVWKIMSARGLRLCPDEKDPYVNRLGTGLRAGRELYLLDRLLLGGIVEARGCERFGLVAAALPPGPLKDLYDEITRSEARHHGLFVRLARTYFEPAAVETRLEELLQREATIARELPLRPALH